MDKHRRVADFDLLNLIFHSAEEDLQKTRWQQPALYTLEYAMVQHLISMGQDRRPMAGTQAWGARGFEHRRPSFSYDDGFPDREQAGPVHGQKPAVCGAIPGSMIAVDAPMRYLEEKVAARENVYFTNFNSPHQVVLGGDTVPLLNLLEEIKREGYRATQLKVSMAFHSPIMKVIHEEMEAFVAGIAFHPSRIPVVSNTTMEPYPDDPDRMRHILMAHLESPVHWMQNVKTLWNDFGIRLFVEIGPKRYSLQPRGQTLEGPLRAYLHAEGEAQAYRAGVAQLYASGHLGRAKRSGWRRRKRKVFHRLCPHRRSGFLPLPKTGGRHCAAGDQRLCSQVLRRYHQAEDRGGGPPGMGPPLCP